MKPIHAPKARLPWLLCALLAACGGAADRGQGQDARDAGTLPGPEAATGPVTGMPARPGPGKTGDALRDAPDPTPFQAQGLDAAAFAGPDATQDPAADGTAATDAGTGAGPATEPGASEAVAAIRAYYAAIQAQRYDAAYASWSDEGRASGQTPAQFAQGFADTATVSVQVGEPGREDAAAGSRYIEIPVTVDATHADGSTHRYVGSYVLRRAVVDGATAAQRSWRIVTADLRELRP